MAAEQCAAQFPITASTPFMPDPELTLKATPPRMPRQPLERPRLTQFWTACRGCAALLVTAPAGFGKTTLMLQWRMQWIEQGAVVAWYSADTNDDPLRFSTGIVQAVRQATQPAGCDGEPSVRGGVEALTILLAEIVQAGRETVLMLDDAERLPAETLPLLQYLLLNAPDHLHLVIGSRVALALHTGRLMAQGHVARLDAEQLRFRIEESMALLERQLGPRLDTDERARLHDATEGWPIALQSAMAAIEHDPDPASALLSLSVRRAGVQDCFGEILDTQVPEDMAQVLTRIASLDNFNVDLVVAITGRADAGDVVRRLATSVPLALVGAHGDWLRLHPLVRDMFRERFARLPAQEQAALHTRAARWFIDHGHLHEAAAHALAAGNDTQAQQCAAQSFRELRAGAMSGQAQHLLHRVPNGTFADDIGFRLSTAMALTIGNRSDEALRMARGVFTDARATPEMRTMALRAATTAAAYADRLGLFPDLVASWIELADIDPLHAMARANARAFALLHAGQTAEARGVLAQVLPTADVDTSPHWTGQMLFAETHLWDGHPALTVDVLVPALARAERAEGRRGVVACQLASILAAALLQTGHADAARALLANRLDVVERFGFPDNVLMAYRTLAHVALRREDIRGAHAALAELDALGVRRKLPRLRVHALAERIRIHAGDACHQAASELAQMLQGLLPAFDAEALAPLRPHARVAAWTAMAHAAFARGALGEAEQLLRDAALETRPQHDGRDARMILALQAVIAHERQAADAQAALQEAMRLAQVGGDEDFSAQLHPIARRMLARDDDVVAPVRPSTGKTRRLPARGAHACVDMLLTPKEMEVLGLLNRGMSNKRIALMLNVGSETVKWHVKNLYAKLSAVSRDHAIDRARLLGLIGN